MKTKLIPLLFLTLLTKSLSAQITRLNNEATNASEYVGWQNTSGIQKDLDITNNWQLRDINFTTNDGTTTAIRVKLQDDGNLGIGTTTPNRLLELGAGDLNLTDGIIRIGDDEMVLYDATAI